MDEASPSPKKAPNRTAYIWRHFTTTTENNKKVNICNHCKSPRSVFSTGSGNSTLERHLKSAHHHLIPKPKQKTPFDTQTAMPKKQKEETDEALLGWFVDNYQPFSVANNPSFRHFMHKASPAYKVPDRKTVGKRIIIRAAEAKKETARELKAKATAKIALTTDTWTSTARDSFSAVTGHFITTEWDLKSLVVGMVSVEGSHTGENLKDGVVQNLKELDVTQVSAVVTDSAANARKESGLINHEMSDGESLRCICHIIHLVAMEGLESIPDSLKKAKAVVTYLRKSTSLCSFLRQACKRIGVVYREPKTNCDTRWNSTLTMLDSIIPMKTALQSLAEISNLLPNDDEWTQLARVAAFLRPFEKATRDLSGTTYATRSMGLHYLKVLKGCIGNAEDHPNNSQDLDLAKMRSKLSGYMSEIEKKEILHRFLDPRFVNSNVSEQAAAIIEIKKILPAIQEAEVVEEDPFLQYYHRLQVEKPQKLSDKLAGYPDVRLYIASTKCGFRDDPLIWWKTNEHRFPRVAQLARQYLAIPASSVASEQAFSVAGNFVTKKRNRLAEATVSALLTLKSWRKYCAQNVFEEEHDDDGNDFPCDCDENCICDWINEECECDCNCIEKRNMDVD